MKMNLNAYDNVIEKIDKTKTWINIRKKQLISREIRIRKYVSIVKRYDVKTNSTLYFIAILDNPPENHIYNKLKVDDYGRAKINIFSIWNETYLSSLDNDCNINISLTESDDNGDIYLLDV